MAIDTGALYYLVDPFVQWENVNGKPIVGGHVEVFEAGTDNKIITYADWDGTRHPFKIPLGSDGRAVILVDPGYRYDAYVYDSFNNLVCSRLNIIPLSDGDITIDGMGQVYHDDTLSGKGTPNSPLTVISGGKVYGGIYPIDVNNELDMISADNVPLGVQEPLYFVKDDDEGCIIGIDSSACGKTYSGISPILVDNTANTISITGDIGKDWTEEILSAANDASAAATAWTDSQGYLTGVDLSEYAKESFVISAIDSSTSGLLPTSAYTTTSGSFITALPADVAYTGWVETSIISATSALQPSGLYLSFNDLRYIEV